MIGFFFIYLLPYNVVTMYVDSATVHRNGKSSTRHLLRECYREQGKIKHRTVANISACSPEEIEAMRLALRHKHELTSLSSARVAVQLEQGAACGAVLTLLALAKELGVARALGSTQQGKLALWQVIARAIDQGSRLSFGQPVEVGVQIVLVETSQTKSVGRAVRRRQAHRRQP